MSRIEIKPAELSIRICRAWNEDWFLLTCGDYGARRFNTMTVAWGGLGIMWGRSIATVVVRPTRYTYEFIEQYPDFTLSLFGPEHRDALTLLGSKSGRDGDKIAESGLTPVPGQLTGSPAFDEAELILECRTIYSQDFVPSRFVDPTIDENYPLKDYHRMYFGEILHAEGIGSFRSG